ncbi:MAG: sulfatase-like hydrolase/transferase [Opitutales bacterium]|nr:sulfatase-like hydrolase/transferase [Opitutales bacterium]
MFPDASNRATVVPSNFLTGKKSARRLGPALALATALLPATLPAAAGEPPRPNIIFFMVDDFGRELIGAYGGETHATPNIDRLAAEGMRFDICYATPMCSPTRVMLMSGKYNFRNYDAWGKYRFESDPTIGNTLAEAGYATAVTGKWHLGGWESPPFGPTRAGFQSYATYNYPEQLAEDATGTGNFFWNTHLWLGAPDREPERLRLGTTYSSAYFRDFALRFIEEQAGREGPFFLYYPEILAHRPFVPTDRDGETGEGHRGRAGHADYFPEMVRYTDEIVGTLLEMLERTGQAENTLFIFTSDNGTDNVAEARGMTARWHGRDTPGGKYLPTELGANVPFIAWWPGTIAAGTRYDGPVDFTDFHTTFARLAGATPPEGLDGHDLTPVLTGQGRSTRAYAHTWGVFEYSSRKYRSPQDFPEDILHVLRDERWKYFSNGRLYDLESDPFETGPVPEDKHPEVRTRFAEALKALRSSEPRIW